MYKGLKGVEAIEEGISLPREPACQCPAAAALCSADADLGQDARF
jgi:hypothetical protein